MTTSIAAPRRVRSFGPWMNIAPPGARAVTRQSKGGRWFDTPFRISVDRSRTASVRLYREWIYAPEQAKLRERVRQELRGLDLACSCEVNGEPCHADVLLEIANADQADQAEGGK